MKLVITGGSGQLARRAAELALETVPPEDLIVTTRTPTALASLTARGVAVRYADFAAPQTLAAALQGGERLLLVSSSELRDRDVAHRAAIDAAKAVGVRHVIYTSGLQPAPPNPAVVAPSHYATEQALARSGLEWTVLRMSLYADYQLLEAERALATGVLVHNRGAGTVAYVAREDCAAAAAAVLVERGHEGAIYGITGPESFGASALAALYAELGGKPVSARALNDAAFVAMLLGGAAADDHSRYGAELVASFGRSIREGYMSDRTDWVEKLTRRKPMPLRQVLAPLAAPRP